MKTKKVKVSEATNNQLNWLVASCEGDKPQLMRNDDGSLFPQPVWKDGLWQCCYSTSWNQMGPIIEREGIGVWRSAEPTKGLWCAAPDDFTSLDLPDFESRMDTLPDPVHGPTPLIAAARCYVASKLGDEVEVPEELT